MNLAQEQGEIKIKTAQWMILLVERKEPKQKKAQWIVPSAYAGGIFIGAYMRLKILSAKFYDTYSHCEEILKKTNRPYACLTIELDGLLFAVPFRHHIRHPHAFYTIGEAGLDYTKSVIITDSQFLSDDRPSIENKEFAIIKRNEQKIRYGLSKYINQYKRSMKHRNNPRSENILKFSTLKYFEEYLHSGQQTAASHPDCRKTQK